MIYATETKLFGRQKLARLKLNSFSTTIKAAGWLPLSEHRWYESVLEFVAIVFELLILINVNNNHNN